MELTNLIMICLKWNKKRKNEREIKRMETQIKKDQMAKKHQNELYGYKKTGLQHKKLLHHKNNFKTYLRQIIYSKYRTWGYKWF